MSAPAGNLELRIDRRRPADRGASRSLITYVTLHLPFVSANTLKPVNCGAAPRVETRRMMTAPDGFRRSP